MNGHPLATSRSQVYDLKDITDTLQKPIVVLLSQGSPYGEFQHPLAIPVVRFIPKEGDKINHEWSFGGRKRQLTMPPLCVADVEASVEAVNSYIQSALPNYLKHLISSSEPLTQRMLLRAREKSTESPFINNCLSILAMNRMIERDWQIINPEVLGLKPVNEDGCPWNGIVPVTPAMDTVLDQIVIQRYLKKLRDDVVSELEGQIYLKKKRDGVEMFFAVFVLATNNQLLLRHSRGNARRYEVPRRYNSMALAKEYFETHNILLSYCLTVVRPAWERRRIDSSAGLLVPSNAVISEEDGGFFEDIQDLITPQEGAIRRLRSEHRYEEELHWSHQLFEPHWKPDSVNVYEEE